MSAQRDEQMQILFFICSFHFSISLFLSRNRILQKYLIFKSFQKSKMIQSTNLKQIKISR
jgi:hypothetical protein